MPKVSEEEADVDIARAIREVRAEQARKLGHPPPLQYRHYRQRKKTSRTKNAKSRP
jgi:hypothetical protein